MIFSDEKKLYDFNGWNLFYHDLRKEELHLSRYQINNINDIVWYWLLKKDRNKFYIMHEYP